MIEEEGFFRTIIFFLPLLMNIHEDSRFLHHSPPIKTLFFYFFRLRRAKSFSGPGLCIMERVNPAAVLGAPPHAEAEPETPVEAPSIPEQQLVVKGPTPALTAACVTLGVAGTLLALRKSL